MPTPSGSGPMSASTASLWGFNPAAAGGIMPRRKRERGRPPASRPGQGKAHCPETIYNDGRGQERPGQG